MWNKRLFLSWSRRNSSWYTVNFASRASPPILKWSFLLKPTMSTSHLPAFKSLSMKLYFCSVKYLPRSSPICTLSLVGPVFNPSKVFGFSEKLKLFYLYLFLNYVLYELPWAPNLKPPLTFGSALEYPIFSLTGSSLLLVVDDLNLGFFGIQLPLSKEGIAV